MVLKTEIIIYILLLFHLLYFSFCNIIELKFKKKEIQPNLSDNEVYKFLESNPLLSEINLGTPSQKLLIVPKTERIFSYIVEDNEEADKKPKDLIQFNSASSSSFVQSEKIKSFSWLYGKSDFFTETVKLGEVEIRNLTMIRALSYESVEPVSSESGIIGLGIINTYEDDLIKANLIKNLKHSQIINSYNFFILYENEREGKIIIGAEPNGYNNKIFNKTNTLVRLPRIDSVFWGFDIDNISYNNIDVKSTVYTLAKIRLEYGFIGVGEKIKSILDKDLFSELKEKGICKQIKFVYSSIYVCNKDSFDKSKLFSLKIYNKDFDFVFEIPFSKLFYDYGDKSYFLVEFRQDGTIQLGEPFLKNNLIVFNQDSKTLAMYNKNLDIIKEKPKTSKRSLILFTILAIIIIAIITGLTYLFYKYSLMKIKPKKKVGIELVDDNYYTNISDKSTSN
ncbi:MAG: pepsin-like aspartyl protease [archaeon]|nr:pepsin-like aspartyl protease [archaeon]